MAKKIEIEATSCVRTHADGRFLAYIHNNFAGRYQVMLSLICKLESLLIKCVLLSTFIILG